MRHINIVTVLLVTIYYDTIRSVVISDNTSGNRYDLHGEYKSDDLSSEDTEAAVGPPRQKQHNIRENLQTTTVKIDREDVPTSSITDNRGASFRVPNGLNSSFRKGGSFGSLVIGNSFPTFGQNSGRGTFVNDRFSHLSATGRLNGGFRNEFSSSFGQNEGSSNGYNSQGNGVGLDSGYNGLQPVIHKSVYVHVAPPDDDIPRPKVIVPQVPPQKNYQIVFIKAPTQPPPAIPVIPPYPPQSDKTLIYVLHPKPEEAPPIRIPAPPPKIPIKPEVYFIRYKAHKENGIEQMNDNYRRYGRNDDEKDEESLDAKETEGKTSPLELNLSPVQYDDEDLNDMSEENSNTMQIDTIERRNNVH